MGTLECPMASARPKYSAGCSSSLPTSFQRGQDVVGMAVLPPETDPELLVDADAVLPGPVASRSLEAIPGGDAQLAQAANAIELVEFALGHRPQGLRAGSLSPATCHPVEDVLR